MITRVIITLAHLAASSLSALSAQESKMQNYPDAVFQYTSWGKVRFELNDLANNPSIVTCSYTEQGKQSRVVDLNAAELKSIESLLRSLKKESYSLSLPEQGVVLISDGELDGIELNAISLGLTYRDAYESAKSHKPVRLLVEWVKRKFPQIATPK